MKGYDDFTVMGTAPRASRERFSDDGEALMDALRRQRVAHRTLVTVEVYIGKIERRNRENIATLRAALDGLVAAVELTLAAGDPPAGWSHRKRADADLRAALAKAKGAGK